MHDEMYFARERELDDDWGVCADIAIFMIRSLPAQ
jgi:hypothetical protein